MNGPLAYIGKPNGIDVGLYLGSARIGADVNGNKPEQSEITIIEQFDLLVANSQPGFVMFGFYGYPRRGVTDMTKARRLVERLLREYAAGKWR
jgi:hypothetical protein